jgi:molybdenum cofactor synthesis domain-containing protein
MLTTSDALRQIIGSVTALAERERIPLDECVGRVLATDVLSDVDLPPFEKSAMDGFALRAADLSEAGRRDFEIAGEARAGAPFRGAVPLGACVAIYTGAEVPSDCDAVVIVEQSEALDARRVRLNDRPTKGQNICNRGMDLSVGMHVLAPGRRVRAVDLALLAAVGCEPVQVVRRPRVAVLTSGDELVAPDQRPGAGQIREGNTLHLAAMARAAGAEVVLRGVVRDDERELERSFAAALERCDALITTGGVSMGKYDLVGAALGRIGVRGLFHKVAIKPGKPLWYGVAGHKPVFALPGNPVSCLVNHEVFVTPALRKLGGESTWMPELRRGRWNGPARESNPREQYLPVRAVVQSDSATMLEPVRWNGSADVVGISNCTALAIAPASQPLQRGDVLEWRALG